MLLFLCDLTVHPFYVATFVSPSFYLFIVALVSGHLVILFTLSLVICYLFFCSFADPLFSPFVVPLFLLFHSLPFLLSLCAAFLAIDTFFFLSSSIELLSLLLCYC